MSSLPRRLAVRLVVFALVLMVLPGYLLGVLQTHMTKRQSTMTPARLRLAFNRVRWQTADGVNLRGWFVPRSASARCAIVCHGLGADQADVLDLVLEKYLD